MRALFRRWALVATVGAISFMVSHSSAADFPEIDKLPAHEELPDPLVMFDGTPVTTRDRWTERRKPELKALFQHYMYGEIPASPKISATVRARRPRCCRRQGDDEADSHRAEFVARLPGN